MVVLGLVWVMVFGGGSGVWCGGNCGGGVEQRKIWWFGFWVLFGFESMAAVVVGGVTGLFGSGGGWLRERRRVREIEMEEREIRGVN